MWEILLNNLSFGLLCKPKPYDGPMWAIHRNEDNLFFIRFYRDGDWVAYLERKPQSRYPSIRYFDSLEAARQFWEVDKPRIERETEEESARKKALLGVFYPPDFEQQPWDGKY